jgi:hypothetical protein
MGVIAVGTIAFGALAYFGPDTPKTADVVTIAQDDASRARAITPPQLPGELHPRPLRHQRGELFEAYSSAPPAPPSAPPAPYVPTPPPNPYRYAGSIDYDGQHRAILAFGDRLLAVKQGDLLEQGFRVQSIMPQVITLLYEALDVEVAVARASHNAPEPAAVASAPAPPIAVNALDAAGPPLLSQASPFPPGSPLNPPGVFRSR